jgi:sugar-specific transcriptional regulator TrmB
LASQDKEVQILTRLGLTFSQAKVYLALGRSGTSTAKTISQVSNIAREHVYEIMRQLQDLGLVEKVLTRPSEFRPIPIREGFSFLLQRRIKETSELQAKTIDLVKNLFESKEKKVLQRDGSQFVLIPKKEAIIQAKKKKAENTQTSIDCITTLKRFLQVAHTYGEVISEALERGVKIRVITQTPEDDESLPGIVKDFKKNPSYRLRYVLKSPSAVVTVYDKKELLIVTSPTADLAESPALLSNNSSLLKIIQDYFEILWITALEHARAITSNHKRSYLVYKHV